MSNKHYAIALILLLLLTGLSFVLLMDNKTFEPAPLGDCGSEVPGRIFEKATSEQLQAVNDLYTSFSTEGFEFTDHKQLTCLYLSSSRHQGYFLLGKGPSKPKLFLQATHTHNDLFTGQILLNLMSGMSHTIGYMASISRAVTDSSTDPTLLNKVALDLMIENKELIAIQLHGFARGKRQTEAGLQADMIISSGHSMASDATKKLYQCLDSRFENVYLYGTNVSELGGTQNFLNKSVRAEGISDKFIQVELSYETRIGLLSDKERSKSFRACLGELMHEG
ncbi:hypothetical protein [Kangiella marina]|uniref:Uncharacterized protein n=1 Tax=Kangiella marina TaxID=1079178 RepID=A0ABP8IB29_9GAMM